MTGGGESFVVEERSSVVHVAASAAAVASAVISCSKATVKHDYDDVADVEEVEEEEGEVDDGGSGMVEDDGQLEQVRKEEEGTAEEEEEDRVGYEIVALASAEQDQDTYSTSSSSSYSSSSSSEPGAQQVPEVMETAIEQGAPLKSALKKTGDQLSKKGLRVSFLFVGKDSWTANGTSNPDEEPPLLLTVREFQVPLDDYHDSPAVINLTDSVEDIPDTLTEENVKRHEILMEEGIQQKEEAVVPVIPGTNGTSSRVDPPVGVLRSPPRPKAPPPPPPPLPPPLVKVTPPVPVPGGKKMFQPSQPSPKELSLSPPLKELTVNVPAGYGNDNWHIELSPLSSVPDSVSSDGSTVSSQDTIIMMTTEECRRNEEHMRQSEMDYELSLMEAERPATKQPFPSSSSASSSSSSSSSSTSSSGSSESVDSVKSKPVTRTNSQVRSILQRTALKRSQMRASDAVRRPNNGSLADKLDEDDPGALEDAIRRLMTDDNDHQDQWNDQNHRKEQMRRSLIIGGSAPELNREVPSRKNNSMDTSRNVNGSFLERSNGGTNVTNGVRDAEEDLDELARFVEVGSERLERLRKRYSYSEEFDDGQGFGRKPSVRGIKPRFGSTHEILQQMQQNLQVHPLMVNPGSTMTWPYGVTVSGVGGASVPLRGRRSGLVGPKLPKVYEDVQEDNAKKPEGNYWKISGAVRGAPEGSSGGQGQVKVQRPPPPPYGSDPRHLLYMVNNRALDINRNG